MRRSAGSRRLEVSTLWPTRGRQAVVHVGRRATAARRVVRRSGLPAEGEDRGRPVVGRRRWCRRRTGWAGGQVSTLLRPLAQLPNGPGAAAGGEGRGRALVGREGVIGLRRRAVSADGGEAGATLRSAAAPCRRASRAGRAEERLRISGSRRLHCGGSSAARPGLRSAPTTMPRGELRQPPTTVLPLARQTRLEWFARELVRDCDDVARGWASPCGRRRRCVGRERCRHCWENTGRRDRALWQYDRVERNRSTWSGASAW
jgi:hypothetical protein